MMTSENIPRGKKELHASIFLQLCWHTATATQNCDLQWRWPARRYGNAIRRPTATSGEAPASPSDALTSAPTHHVTQAATWRTPCLLRACASVRRHDIIAPPSSYQRRACLTTRTARCEAITLRWRGLFAICRVDQLASCIACPILGSGHTRHRERTPIHAVKRAKMSRPWWKRPWWKRRRRALHATLRRCQRGWRTTRPEPLRSRFRGMMVRWKWK